MPFSSSACSSTSARTFSKDTERIFGADSAPRSELMVTPSRVSRESMK